MTMHSTLKTAFLSTALLMAGCKDKTPEPDYNTLQPETITVQKGITILSNGGSYTMYISKTNQGDMYYGSKEDALNLIENSVDATATTVKIEGSLGAVTASEGIFEKRDASAMSITVDLIPDQVLDVPKAGDPSATRKAKVDKAKFLFKEMTIIKNFNKTPQFIIDEANKKKFTVRKIDLK